MSNSTFDDIEEEVSSWGYSMSVSDYERSLIEDSPKAPSINFPRGRGISDSNYISNVKLVSELNGIVEKAVPLGHLPTTKEVLNDQDANEITPLLRQLGISGHDGPISSKDTRAVAMMENDIRVEGNVPIILNGDLFAMINDHKGSSGADGNAEEDDTYDPERPLHEQFSTIKEFADLAKARKELKKPESDSVTLSSPSSTASDASSSCTSSSSSVINYSASEQDSNDGMCEPLLNIKQPKLYTPRQLYELKRKESLQKGARC